MTPEIELVDVEDRMIAAVKARLAMADIPDKILSTVSVPHDERRGGQGVGKPSSIPTLLDSPRTEHRPFQKRCWGGLGVPPANAVL